MRPPLAAGLPRRCQPVVLRCGMGWLFLLLVLCLVAAVVFHTAWRRLVRFRCDRCRRVLPAAEAVRAGRVVRLVRAVCAIGSHGLGAWSGLRHLCI